MANNPKPIRKRYLKYGGRYEVGYFGGELIWFPAGNNCKSNHARRKTIRGVYKLAEKLFSIGADEVYFRDLKEKRKPEGWQFYSISPK